MYHTIIHRIILQLQHQCRLNISNWTVLTWNMYRRHGNIILQCTKQSFFIVYIISPLALSCLLYLVTTSHQHLSQITRNNVCVSSVNIYGTDFHRISFYIIPFFNPPLYHVIILNNHRIPTFERWTYLYIFISLNSYN